MHVIMDNIIIIGGTLYMDIIMNGIIFWIENSMKIVIQFI